MILMVFVKVYWTQNKILILFPALMSPFQSFLRIKNIKKKVSAFILKTHINIYFRVYARSPQPPRDWAELQSQRQGVSRAQQPCRCRFALTKPFCGSFPPREWHAPHTGTPGSVLSAVTLEQPLSPCTLAIWWLLAAPGCKIQWINNLPIPKCDTFGKGQRAHFPLSVKILSAFQRIFE